MDSEFAGIIVAVGFVVMGLVGMSAVRWFVVGCLVLGGVFALLLRFVPKAFTRVVVGAVTLLIALALWWAGRPPQRPNNVSNTALHVQPGPVGFTLHDTGYWLECWFDRGENLDRCRLTDAKGNHVFEDVFLPCVGQNAVPQTELVLDKRYTGPVLSWTQSPDKRISIPTVALEHGQTLLPRSLFTEAKRDLYCSGE